MGMGVDILCVKRNVLFNDGDFLGFKRAGDKNYLEIIKNNFEYVNRTEELERDNSFQQILPYVWIVNPVTKKVFVYKRSTTGNEGRLYNKYSGGVGGHIDKEESDDPINDSMMRELREEVVMGNYPVPKIVGYINLNHDVHDVHFAVVSIAETQEDVKPAEDMEAGEFYFVDEVDRLFANPENEVEGWTQISWPFVRDYLKNLG
jgi:predicted NUDIX family phosphoesterase